MDIQHTHSLSLAIPHIFTATPNIPCPLSKVHHTMPSIDPVSQWTLGYQKDGSVQHQRIPIPDIESDELLVKLQYTGVCHSGLELQKGVPIFYAANLMSIITNAVVKSNVQSHLAPGSSVGILYASFHVHKAKQI
jgi:hypothetical protein